MGVNFYGDKTERAKQIDGGILVHSSSEEIYQEFIRKYQDVLPESSLNEHFQRSLNIKPNSSPRTVVDYTKKLISAVEGVNSPSRRMFTGSSAIQRQNANIIQTVSEFLEPKEFCNLRGSSYYIEQNLRHPTSKKILSSHLPLKATEDSNLFHLNGVKSINLGESTVDPNDSKDDNDSEMKEPEITNPNLFPNCRSVVWQPNISFAPNKNDYVESKTFSLQGMEGLYMRLYPRGKQRSKPGYCSLYMGSAGTESDVMLKLRIGNHSHIIAQKLSKDYVDGFVNFCPVNPEEPFDVVVEVMHGPNDKEVEGQKLDIPVSGGVVKWTIPRMSKDTLDSFAMGDRITSDTFNLPSLGEEACFVIYPKGDTVDAISSVGNFVNVGLFGSADRDVTFRLSSGKVSKVLTASKDRFSTKIQDKTKSCGEFFDACFATIEELTEDSFDESLSLTLEILDTAAEHKSELIKAKPTVETQFDEQPQYVHDGNIQWEINNLQPLRDNLENSEKIYSRYSALNVPDGFDHEKLFHDQPRPKFKQIKGVFQNFALSFEEKTGDVAIDVTLINSLTGKLENPKLNYLTADIDIQLELNGWTKEVKSVKGVDFLSLQDSKRFVFNGLGCNDVNHVLLKVKLSNVEFPSLFDTTSSADTRTRSISPDSFVSSIQTLTKPRKLSLSAPSPGDAATRAHTNATTATSNGVTTPRLPTNLFWQNNGVLTSEEQHPFTQNNIGYFPQ